MKGTGAAILAAGKGTRMGSEVPKQYLELHGKPLFLYSIETYLPLVDDLVLVTNEEGMDFCRDILASYGLSDRVSVVKGGKNRYDSSLAGIEVLRRNGRCNLVLIHDAARANVRPDTIQRVIDAASLYEAAIAAVPSKDTIKSADEEGFVKDTPDRRTLWCVQTPQGFTLDLIEKAYALMKESSISPEFITDDAMVVETFTGHKVKLVMGDETNLKMTTPGDLAYMERYLMER